MDSDGDGFSNGAELGDPDGDGVPIPGAQVTNPGNAASRPNPPPNFTSTPVTNAVIGVRYEYTATASDPDGTTVIFSKIAGPTWLSVSGGGLASGTPPERSAGNISVTIRARDNGSPAAIRDQTYTLTVHATFAGWQQMHFSLPEEQAIAAPDADPDGDGVPNLVEYAMRANPRAANPLPLPMMLSFDGNIRMTLTLDVRDDDPDLLIIAEFAADVGFPASNVASAAVSDPVPGDGWKTVVFEDSISRTSTGTRFGRLRFSTVP